METDHRGLVICAPIITGKYMFSVEECKNIDIFDDIDIVNEDEDQNEPAETNGKDEVSDDDSIDGSSDGSSGDSPDNSPNAPIARNVIPALDHLLNRDDDSYSLTDKSDDDADSDDEFGGVRVYADETRGNNYHGDNDFGVFNNAHPQTTQDKFWQLVKSAEWKNINEIDFAMNDVTVFERLFRNSSITPKQFHEILQKKCDDVLCSRDFVNTCESYNIDNPRIVATHMILLGKNMYNIAIAATKMCEPVISNCIYDSDGVEMLNILLTGLVDN